MERGRYRLWPWPACDPEGLRPNWGLNVVYDNDEWATGIVTDYDVKANRAKMFNDISVARFVSIQTSAEISVKFNNSSNDTISIAANTVFNIDVLEITNIFLTAAATANVKIFLA